MRFFSRNTMYLTNFCLRSCNLIGYNFLHHLINKAVIFKNKLIKQDYPVYIVSTLIKEKGYTLHRVFVGNFLRKIEAENVAVKIKESEKIKPLVRYLE